MKRTLLAFCMLILFISLVGCAPISYPDIELQKEWSVTDDIVFSLEYEEYPVGVESMRMIMRNKGDTTLLYGFGWSFERYEKGEWKPVATKDNIGFESIGYLLNEHSKNTFDITPWFLKDPLKEGIYRVTGCSLYEDVEPGGQNKEYPPYQFIFRISKDAQTPITANTEPLLKEDWQWMTDREILPLYESEKQNIWQFIKGQDGLMALLYRDDTPENEILKQGDLLKLDIFDRKNGERYTVYAEPTIEADSVRQQENGFLIESGDNSPVFVGIVEGELFFSTQR